jgi:hypothetical protein
MVGGMGRRAHGRDEAMIGMKRRGFCGQGHRISKDWILTGGIRQDGLVERRMGELLERAVFVVPSDIGKGGTTHERKIVLMASRLDGLGLLVEMGPVGVCGIEGRVGVDIMHDREVRCDVVIVELLEKRATRVGEVVGRVPKGNGLGVVGVVCDDGIEVKRVLAVERIVGLVAGRGGGAGSGCL